MACVSICRLCTKEIAGERGEVNSIENHDLEMKIATVFLFTIERKHGYSVCQMCSDIVCQFYEFSEKVRLNQEKLAINDQRPLFGEVKPGPVEVSVTTDNLNLSVDESQLELESSCTQDDSCEDIFDDFIHNGDEPDKQSNKNQSEEQNYRTEQKRKDKIQDFCSFVCEICGDSVPYFLTLRRHYRKNHDVNGYVRCCKKKFFKRRDLFEHLKNHVILNRPIRDNSKQAICIKKSNNECLLIYETHTHGTIEERPFKCDLCSSGEEFLSKNAYVQHLQQHQEVKALAQKFQCPTCHKWFTRKQSCQKHMQHIHNKSGQSFICDVCNKTYTNLRALRNHKNEVHVDSVFNCEICGKNFKRSRSLKEHRASHTDETLYKCRFCGLETNYNGSLYAHIKKYHSNELVSECKANEE